LRALETQNLRKESTLQIHSLSRTSMMSMIMRRRRKKKKRRSMMKSMMMKKKRRKISQVPD
jgi:hypothetical protein